MQKIGLNPERLISDEDYDVLEDKVSEYLMKHGFDENYQPTEVGKICESILDLLGDI